MTEIKTEIFDKNEDEQNQILSSEENAFVLTVYRDYFRDRAIKEDSYDILGGRTLQQFWDRSNWDYNVLVDDNDTNDPVVPYATTISRDKANTFIGNLTISLVYPSITAQNQNQEIDHVVSGVGRPILEYSYDNDGAPSENGHKKTVRAVHKMVIEGTNHVQDDWIDGKLFSQLVPNEQVFIPNFWQPDIQLQAHVMRVQDDVTFREAEREFGDLPNWKYVKAGFINTLDVQDPAFKTELEGLVSEDVVQIIRIWYDIPKKEFKRLGIPKKQKRAKLFNVVINGVLMFKTTNLSPYKHGLYPLTKGIFEHFSKAEFYWGNSMPNKAKEDKKWLDGWKTLIRHKAKLSAIPPLLTFNGSLVDEDVYVPGRNTQAPAGMKAEDIAVVPGINTKGVEQGDIAIMNMAKSEIDEGNLSPQAAGGEGKSQTAREAIIREQNEQKILGAFGLQVSFFLQSRAFPILKMAFQFMPRKKIKKLVIPDQKLEEGKQGNLEIVFEKPEAMTGKELLQASRDIRQEEFKAEKEGRPKKIVKINPEYLNNLDLYVKQIADPRPIPTGALRELRAREKWAMYSSAPAIFNVLAAARKLVRESGDDESEMINKQPQTPQQPQATPQSAGQKTLNRVAGQEGAELTI